MIEKKKIIRTICAWRSLRHATRPIIRPVKYIRIKKLKHLVLQTLTETYDELSRLFGDYYALSVTQLFAFSDKHAAFERNGNMSLFEKFELAREVSEICDSVVPLIKVVIVEGGNRGDGRTVTADDVAAAAVQSAAAGRRRRRSDGRRDDERLRLRENGGAGKLGTSATGTPAGPHTETCRNPFGAIMDDDVDCAAECQRSDGKRNKTTAGKSIELKVYSRSVSYFHERAVDERVAAIPDFLAGRPPMRASVA